jgi:hypothetical protein
LPEFERTLISDGAKQGNLMPRRKDIAQRSRNQR